MQEEEVESYNAQINKLEKQCEPKKAAVESSKAEVGKAEAELRKLEQQMTELKEKGDPILVQCLFISLPVPVSIRIL